MKVGVAPKGRHLFILIKYYQYILKEYLAYKLWELVSPDYFRTQLVHIHYTNPDGTDAHDPSYAFFVETLKNS